MYPLRACKTALTKLPYVFLLTVLAAVLVAPALASPELNDQSIRRAVEDELLEDSAVMLNDIDVQCSDGIVVLSGRVGNVLAQERAARVTQTVRGVKAVVNDIAVVPPERSDAAIAEDVSLALMHNPATDSFEIAVNVSDGVVTLEGDVESWTEADLAETVAEGVRGVVSVNNQIDSDPSEPRRDEEIESDIEQQLAWDVLIQDGLVDVDVADGVVTLTGFVGSSAEKKRARMDAWVPGVELVDFSRLKVDPDLRDEDLRKAVYKDMSDDRIASALEKTLTLDPVTDEYDIQASVENRIVHLEGTVPSLKVKRAAAQDARNTVGVVAVRNRLRVRSEHLPDDEVITERVERALSRDPYVERFDVAVETRNGVVDLSGTVDSYFEKSHADDIAAGVRGVVRIDNDLIVTDTAIPYVRDPYVDRWFLSEHDWFRYDPPRTFRTDLAIEQDIETELWWSAVVSAGDVSVDVDNGVAELTGTVDSWREWRAARQNAFEGGATWVINNLTVENGSKPAS